MNDLNGFSLIAPVIPAELDPGFRPPAPANQAFRREVEESGRGQPVAVALERGAGSISRFETTVFAGEDPRSRGNGAYLERWLKFLLWSRGAARIHVSGPDALVANLQTHFRETPLGRFDAEIMGEKIYETPFEVLSCRREELPEENEAAAALGRHFEGCRIGFDLGASDRKAAAVQDGEMVFSEEIPWDPKSQSDPGWHFEQIMDSLRRAAKHLPRVDAIGGSSAGVYVDNEVKVASLFRGVPDEIFREKGRRIFRDLREAWGGIPFDVVNDGEVTALAGSIAIQDNGVLGIAMGSSEAAGYVTPQGNITPWLNELAFAPVDYNPEAPVDEWSGYPGCGALYFSQQCVGRLVEPAGLEISPGLALPEKLVAVQELMEKGDERAARIYRTIGVYLGYTIAHYADFYDFRYLLTLGRVTTGKGGELVLDKAREVLRKEFPELDRKVRFHVPDELEKRHGQAVAAASLPSIPPDIGREP